MPKMLCKALVLNDPCRRVEQENRQQFRQRRVDPWHRVMISQVRRRVRDMVNKQQPLVLVRGEEHSRFLKHSLEPADDSVPERHFPVGIFDDCTIADCVEWRHSETSAKGGGDLLGAEVPEGGNLCLEEVHIIY